MFRASCVSLCVVVCSGCGGGINTDYSGLDLIDVGGVVTLDGNPVPDATVVFEAEDGTASFGTTDASGEFELQFNSEKSGVLPGRKTVRISTTSSFTEEGADGELEEEGAGEEEGTGGGAAEELLPECYNTQSTLIVDVDADTDWLVFDLKGDCSTTTAK